MPNTFFLLIIFLLFLFVAIVFYAWLQAKKQVASLNLSNAHIQEKELEQSQLIQQLQTEIILKTHALEETNHHFDYSKQKNKELEHQVITLKEELTHLTVTIEKLENKSMYEVQHNNELRSQLKELENQLKIIVSQKEEWHFKATQLEENNRYLVQKNQEQILHFENIQKENLTRFESLANKVLEQNTQQFSQQQHKELSGVLNPLKENIALFQKQVQEVYEKEEKRRFSLEEQVKQLMTLNNALTEEAQKLTKALSNQSKVQGDWGELILEQILEYSGLQKNVHYFVQESIKDESGKTLLNALGKSMIPDVLVKYPGNRQLIIDAKCSIKDYIAWTDEEDQSAAKIHLNQHLYSVKKHIQDLSKKNYQKYIPSLDFVMMLLPNEGAYTAALSAAPDLWLEAYQKRVLLVSPSNLIASLKLIDHLWIREEQDRNTQAIIERGNLLYEKIVGFVEDFNKIDQELQRTYQVYEAAKNKLYLGRGNVIRQTELLKELGMQSNKELPDLH